MAEDLTGRIARLVRANGPLPLAEYMHLCLADPRLGYYARRTAFGRTGDFVTAPEISQVFGELLGIWCVAVWQAIGAPSRFTLAEAGPGNGTMMADMLRAAATVPDFAEAADIALIEASPRLREAQARKLARWRDRLRWIPGLEAVGDLPLILVANEFLDALPVRQYIKTAAGWRERCVGLDASGKLLWVAGGGVIDPALLPPGARDEPAGAVFEYAPARNAWVEKLCQNLAATGGAALLIDYGHARSGFGDTFQAVRGHAFADPLAAPGRADLTAHVDFAAIDAVARDSGAAVSPLLSQRSFLFSMGLAQRLERLARGQPEPVARRLEAGARRLVEPGRMGELFKVMGLAPARCAPAVAALPPFGAAGAARD